MIFEYPRTVTLIGNSLLIGSSVLVIRILVEQNADRIFVTSPGNTEYFTRNEIGIAILYYYY